MRIVALLALAGCNISDVRFMKGDGDGGTDSSPDSPAVASGEYVWIRSLSTMLPLGTVPHPGGLIVTGYIVSTADLGGQLLTSAGGADIVIASFNESSAAHLYSKRYGDTGGEFGFMDVADPAGTPVVVGVSSGTVDFGQGPAAGGGGTDGFIGAYPGGSFGWVKRIVGASEDKIISSASAGGSSVYGVGWFEGTPTFNGSQLTSAGRDCFLARFNTFTGAVDLTKQFGGPGRDEFAGSASRAGDFVIAGFFDDTIAFGGTAAPITATAGSLDMFVVKIASDGNGVWAVTYGGTGEDRGGNITIDMAGDIYVTGQFMNQLTFGSTQLTSLGGYDVFLVKLSGGDGSVVWATSIGTAGMDNAGRIAVDDKGNLAWVGSVTGSLDGGPTEGGVDAVIQMHSAADGSRKWRKLFSTAGDDRAGTVAFGQGGDVIVGASIAGAYDFGHAVIGAPNPVGVLLRIAP